MCLLKRFFAEDVPSILGRHRQGPAGNDGSVPLPSTPASPSSELSGTHTSPATGMTVVILNWKEGENDPFTVVNHALAGHFRACGKNVEIIEISDVDWPNRLVSLGPSRIEFAFTWQGLGTSVQVTATGENVWDRMKVPLICLHADHPSHMPANHQLESPYCFHVYTNGDFARYSNRHFRRTRSAGVIDIPQLFRERRLRGESGDYFVVAKNVDDPIVTERIWSDRLRAPHLDSYLAAAETLKSRLTKDAYVELHDVLDELIVEGGWDWLDPTTHVDVYHEFHSRLDHYIRSYKSTLVISSLAAFPLKIFGRGWQRFAEHASAHHVFEGGRAMANSQELYYSRFGLIDISPSKLLHDRTRRAMVNGRGFLSSANLEDLFADVDQYESLFYSFRPDDLQGKCATVVADPALHRERAASFAEKYHNTFRIRDFVRSLEELARVAVVHRTSTPSAA
jgi:hypothetical protein